MMISAGLSGFVGNVPFRLLNGAYRAAGFDLTFGDDRRLQRLINGDYQIAAVSLNSILMNLEAFRDQARVVYAYVRAVGKGSDLIICRGQVDKVADLARRRIGVQRGGLEHFIFEYLFFTSGIKRETEYKWLPRNAYAESLANGEIDAAVFCDPALTQILRDSRFQLFAGAMQDVALTAVGVIAVRKEMLTERRDDVSRFISILNDGIEAVKASGDETLKKSAPSFFEGIDNPKQTLISRVAFLTRAENRMLFSSHETQSFSARWPQWLRFLDESGFFALPSSAASATEIFDEGIVNSL